MDGLAVDGLPVGGAFVVGQGVEEGFAEGSCWGEGRWAVREFFFFFGKVDWGAGAGAVGAVSAVVVAALGFGFGAVAVSGSVSGRISVFGSGSVLVSVSVSGPRARSVSTVAAAIIMMAVGVFPPFSLPFLASVSG